MAKIIIVYAPPAPPVGGAARDLPGATRYACYDRHPRHPANPDWGYPAEEVKIRAGDGMAGRTKTVYVDPTDRSKGTEEVAIPAGIRVFDGSRIIRRKLAEGAIVQVSNASEIPGASDVDRDDLTTLEGLSTAAIERLERRGISGVLDLSAALQRGQDPVEDLEIPKSVATKIRDQLVERGHLQPADD